MRMRRDYCSTVKQNIRFRLALKQQKRLCAVRRRLSWGERRQIILRRFGSLGSTEVVGLSYGKIAKALVVRHRTVIEVCQAYLRRGGDLPFKQRQPDKWRLTAAQRAWTCDRLTLIDHAALSLD